MRRQLIVAVVLAATVTVGAPDAGRLSVAASSIGSAPSATPTSALPYPVGLTNHTFAFDGVTRSYRVHVPPGITQPTAIVFVLHGGGGEGSGVADNPGHPLSVYRSVADAEGFVAVYPEGLPDTGTQQYPSWTDCRSDNRVASGADDVGFLAALLTDIQGRYGLGSERSFMAGSSNGAQMAQAFAFNRPDLVAAVASNAGGQPLNPRPGQCTTGPSQSVPIMLGHGTADPQMPFGGGCVADLGGQCNRGRVISAEDTRDRWLAINGLTSVTPTTATINTNTNDAGPANLFAYAGDGPVHWWRFDGGGHMAPSKTVSVASSPINGVQNRDVEFAALAWQFFEAQIPVVTQPGAPTDLEATAGDQQVSLTWSEPADTGGAPILDYLIEYAPNGDTWTTFDDGTSDTTGATVTGLTNGTAYAFRVSATNAAGTGIPSTPSAPVTPISPVTSPGQPGVPTVAPGLGVLVVTVAPPSSGGLPSSYLVTAISTTMTPGTGSCTVLGPTGSCTVANLSETGSYRVSVVASNHAGDSVASLPSPAAPQAVTPGAGSSTPQFGDVPAGRFYTRATSLLKARDITNGKGGPTTFEPQGQVTRAEMAAFLYRLAGEPSVAPCTFQDQAAIPNYARSAACWLKAEGITESDPYKPQGLVTRAQMAAFLWRQAGEPATAPCTFQDQAAIPVFAQTGACWLKAERITESDPYSPQTNVTRAQMAAFLYRTGAVFGLWIRVDD